LSDSASIRHCRITRPDFRPCSTGPSRSQAPLCPYTLRAISIRTEGTFGRLRYLLGGDRPSQTTRLILSHRPSPGPRLEARDLKGGIPRSPPSQLASGLHRLPPILYRKSQAPIPSCSKAPRGLSVQSWVTGIFADTTISPSPSLRQRPSRYAVRAGRNLPDKEFRYLRTVIVTAAIHRCFGLERRPAEARLTPLLNIPALGRRQPLYVAFRLSRDLCFW
jgi:hypothetical protein